MESSAILRVDFPSSDIPNFSNFYERRKRRLLRVRDMLAPRALGVSVVPALCSQRLLPKHPLSRDTILAPHDSSFTADGFLSMPPRYSR